MSHYFAEYALFLAKAITFAITFLFVVTGFVLILSRNKNKEKLSIEKLNDQYQESTDLIKENTLSKKDFKKFQRSQKKKQKQQESSTKDRKRVFVIRFEGDIRATQVENLREEITAILAAAEEGDEVFALIESGGGMVHSYGLAASQLARIRERALKLVVSVDKVAASGGYLMACVANEIIAAPFAIVGSIGVLAQLPNFNRLLKKHDIEYEQVTAGEYKRTLTVFGENTDEGRQKMKTDLEEIHQQFKDFITKYRPEIDIHQVATGEHWLGQHAIALNLVDKIQTSDDYLLKAYQADRDLFEICYECREGLGRKVSKLMSAGVRKVLLTLKQYL